MAKHAMTAARRAALRKAQLVSARKRRGKKKKKISKRKRLAAGLLYVGGGALAFHVGRRAYRNIGDTVRGSMAGMKQARKRSDRLKTRFSDELMRTSGRVSAVYRDTGAPYITQARLNAVIRGRKRLRSG